METQSHLCAAYNRKYLDKSEFAKLYAEGTALRKAIIAFIRSMIMPLSGVRNIRRSKTWSELTAEIYERVTGQPPPRPPGVDAVSPAARPKDDGQ